MSLEIIRSTSDGADAAPSALASFFSSLARPLRTRQRALPPCSSRTKTTAPRIAPRGCYKPTIRPADVDRIAQHAGVSVCGLVHIARRNDWTCADLHRLLFDGASRHEVIASSKAALNCEVGALPDKGFETAPCKADLYWTSCLRQRGSDATAFAARAALYVGKGAL